jgi:hypothetical protein
MRETGIQSHYTYVLFWNDICTGVGKSFHNGLMICKTLYPVWWMPPRFRSELRWIIHLCLLAFAFIAYCGGWTGDLQSILTWSYSDQFCGYYLSYDVLFKTTFRRLNSAGLNPWSWLLSPEIGISSIDWAPNKTFFTWELAKCVFSFK